MYMKKNNNAYFTRSINRTKKEKKKSSDYFFPDTCYLIPMQTFSFLLKVQGEISIKLLCLYSLSLTRICIFNRRLEIFQDYRSISSDNY